MTLRRPTRTRKVRSAGAGLLAAAVLLGLLQAGPAAAGARPSAVSRHGLAAGAGAAETTSTTSTAEATPELMGGVSVTGATVDTPGEKQRVLDAGQATAFMQTWFSYSVTVNPPNENPPAGLVVSKLKVDMVVSENQTAQIVFYATDGKDVWVGAPGALAGEPDKWIRVPRPRKTTAGFEGRLEPIRDPVASTTSAPGATTTSSGSAKDGGSSGNSSWALIAAGACVVLGGLAVVAVRARRSSRR